MNKQFSAIAVLLQISQNSNSAMKQVLVSSKYATIHGSDIYYSERTEAKDGIVGFVDYIQHGAEAKVSKIPTTLYDKPEIQKVKRAIKLSEPIVDIIKSLDNITVEDVTLTKPYVRFVYLDEKNIVYTDAHRLAFYSHGTTLMKPIKLPVKVVEVLQAAEMKMVTYYESKTYCALIELNTGKRIIFRKDTSRVKYPEYMGAFPKHPHSITLKTANVVALCEKVSLDKTTTIRLKFTEEGLSIATNDEFLVGTAKTTSKVVSEAVEFGVNVKFLKSVLSLIKDEEFTLHYSTDPERALQFNSNILLMPVRL